MKQQENILSWINTATKKGQSQSVSSQSSSSTGYTGGGINAGNTSATSVKFLSGLIDGYGYSFEAVPDGNKTVYSLETDGLYSRRRIISYPLNLSALEVMSVTSTRMFGKLEGRYSLLSPLFAIGRFIDINSGKDLQHQQQYSNALLSDKIAKASTYPDNMLYNPSFSDAMDGWSVVNEVSFLTEDGLPLVFGKPLQLISRVTAAREYLGMRVLYLDNGEAVQEGTKIKAPGTHKIYTAVDTATDELNTTFLSLGCMALTAGTLKVGFDEGNGLDVRIFPLSAGEIWQNIELSGQWNGGGSFRISYTGKAYIRYLRLYEDRIEENLKTIESLVTLINNGQ